MGKRKIIEERKREKRRKKVKQELEIFLKSNMSRSFLTWPEYLNLENQHNTIQEYSAEYSCFLLHNLKSSSMSQQCTEIIKTISYPILSTRNKSEISLRFFFVTVDIPSTRTISIVFFYQKIFQIVMNILYLFFIRKCFPKLRLKSAFPRSFSD